jgi:hypothetical protein
MGVAVVGEKEFDGLVGDYGGERTFDHLNYFRLSFGHVQRIRQATFELLTAGLGFELACQGGDDAVALVLFLHAAHRQHYDHGCNEGGHPQGGHRISGVTRRRERGQVYSGECEQRADDHPNRNGNIKSAPVLGARVAPVVLSDLGVCRCWLFHQPPFPATHGTKVSLRSGCQRVSIW